MLVLNRFILENTIKTFTRIYLAILSLNCLWTVWIRAIRRQMWRIKNGREGYSSTTFFPIITSVDCNDEIKKRVFWNRRVLCRRAFGVRRAAVKLAVTTDISGNNFRLAQVRPTRAARATLLAAGAGAAIRLGFYYCYFNRFRGVDETCTPCRNVRVQ